MEFFETALEMEKETEQYYRSLAEKCVSNTGIRNILNFLAEDHAKHFSNLELMKNDDCGTMAESTSYEEAKKHFSAIQKERDLFKCDIDQLQLYKKALNLVEKKLNFYMDSIDKLDCPDKQSVLKQIAEEEKHQKNVLENIIEMVEQPNRWVEDAEFYHLDQY